MGSLLVQTSIDDQFSAKVIADLREASQDIDEYVLTQAYLNEATEEMLSPEWLKNRLVGKALEELEDNLGIKVNMDQDQVLDDVMAIQAVCYLMLLFQEDKIYQLLRKQPDLKQVIENEISVDDDSIGNIILSIHDVVPLADDWGYLADYIENQVGVIESTQVFGDWLRKIFERIDRLGDDSVVDQDPLVINQFVQYLARRRDKVVQLASHMLASIREDYNGQPPQDVIDVLKVHAWDIDANKSRPGYIQKMLRPLYCNLDKAKFLDKSKGTRKDIPDYEFNYACQMALMPQEALKAPTPRGTVKWWAEQYERAEGDAKTSGSRLDIESYLPDDISLAICLANWFVEELETIQPNVEDIISKMSRSLPKAWTLDNIPAGKLRVKIDIMLSACMTATEALEFSLKHPGSEVVHGVE